MITEGNSRATSDGSNFCFLLVVVMYVGSPLRATVFTFCIVEIAFLSKHEGFVGLNESRRGWCVDDNIELVRLCASSGYRGRDMRIRGKMQAPFETDPESTPDLECATT